jgi:hypothetical protein
MAKIYYNKYKKMIDNGDITLEEAIELVNSEVPVRWRSQVIELLEEGEVDGKS